MTPETTLMLCPHCKSSQFIRSTQDLVAIQDNGFGPEDEFLQSRDGYEYTCSACGTDVHQHELVREVGA